MVFETLLEDDSVELDSRGVAEFQMLARRQCAAKLSRGIVAR
ncbi:MAG: hypothetical protein U1A72_10990 [Sulfuritalea sp.]|nr:hypothetical protein [Sulfuritalea sp.]